MGHVPKFRAGIEAGPNSGGPRMGEGIILIFRFAFSHCKLTSQILSSFY